MMLVLVVAGCQPRPHGGAQSGYIEQKFIQQFHQVVSAAQLGPEWQAGGAADLLQVYASHDGRRALLTLSGPDYPALWVDGRAGAPAVAYALDYPVLFADPDQGQVYSATAAVESTAPLLRQRELAQAGADWKKLLAAEYPAWDADAILAASRHPQSPMLWVVGSVGAAPAVEPPVESAPAENAQNRTEAAGAPHETPQLADEPQVYAAITACRLTADFTPQAPSTTLPAEDLDTLELAPLADGRALLHVGSKVFLADPESSAPLAEIFNAPGGRDFKLAADMDAGGVGWLYFPPQSSSDGTSRVAAPAQPGLIVAIDDQGQELGRVSAGAVPFDQFAGSWREQRCFLAANTAGVAQADFSKHSLGWLLRQGGDIPLKLVPQARELWAVLPDSIVGIALNDLAKLAPKLLAAQVLTAEQAALLKPAAQALNWDWPAVQLSPLLARTGRLTLFNALDQDASWAEFDWALSANHASRLLIARAPTAQELRLREQAPEQIDTYCHALLTALGWPEAQRDMARGSQDALELQYFYQLLPSAQPPLSTGEFRLWITDQAAVLTLTAATTGFPENTLRVDDARALVAERVMAKLEAEGLSASGLSIARQVQAGWVDLDSIGSDSLSAEPVAHSVPVLRCEALVGAAEPRLWVVYLDAATGQELALLDRGFTPANLLRRASNAFETVGTPRPEMDPLAEPASPGMPPVAGE